MRFMIIVKATEESEAGVMPGEEAFAAMADYHEELARAGALVDASGLHPTSKGWRIEYRKNGERQILDGPFTEAKELVAGYTIIRAESREEAMEWTRRFPNPGNVEGAIEVRQLFDFEDFEPNEAIERFRNLNLPAQA